MAALAVIPARLGSTRLPGKVLADVGGRPLVQWVHERACRAARIARVVIATDADEVEAACRGFGAEVFRSATPHACGTDRVAEVARALGVPDDGLVINLQADEPTLDPALLDALVAVLATAPLASPMTPLRRVADFLDPSVVKVVCDARGDALYFSRAPIPWPRDAALDPAGPWPAGLVAWKHVGVYGYRGDALQRWAAAPRHPLEITESLEQLRALACGDPLRMLPWGVDSLGVDTAEDLARLRRLAGDKTR
ncbi:MAG: 3-deoxy-manno-octulosonate cytidylyltransferase [Myxococcales bacterium]|nr:3-deoxy-manno-octulosonate cytidylyltransferase [Myxococcales bacterium]